jgi:hypothetical protein
MRWLDDVESDLKKMKVKGRKEKMRKREQWRLVVEDAKKKNNNNKKKMMMIQVQYRVYLNSMAKLQELIPHVERRKKGYENMGPEMYGYRVVRACIY